MMRGVCVALTAAARLSQRPLAVMDRDVSLQVQGCYVHTPNSSLQAHNVIRNFLVAIFTFLYKDKIP